MSDAAPTMTKADRHGPREGDAIKRAAIIERTVMSVTGANPSPVLLTQLAELFQGRPIRNLRRSVIRAMNRTNNVLGGW